MSARNLLPGAFGKLVRPLLRRAAHSEAVRRLLIPALLRFPILKRIARIATGAGQRPAADIHLPVWAGPLPAVYLDLPASSRQALLDLARAATPTDRPA